MGIKGHVNRLVVLYFAPLSMDYSLELFELYLATCWTNLSDVLDYTYTCWAEAPKINPTRAKCSTARRYESELRDRSPSRGTLDHSQRPRRYEGHFASTGTRNSKVRTLLFLRIRRGNLLTFGICWTILCDFLESRRLLMDFWDYTWRLLGFKETFSGLLGLYLATFWTQGDF